MRPGFTLPPVTLRILSVAGGLGDQIARIPAYRFAVERHQHVSLIIYVQDFFLPLAEYLFKHPRIEYRRLSEAPWAMPKPFIKFDQDRITSLHLHLTDQAFLMIMDQLPPDNEARQYPKAAPLALSQELERMLTPRSQSDSSKLLVFTVANTAPVRAWPGCYINELAKKVAQAGYTPVLVGSTEKLNVGVEGDGIMGYMPDGIDTSLFVDLTNRTTLLEVLGIIQRAKAVVGVDNGLLHLAHCTSTPVVMGFTTLRPEHRVPYREWPGGKAGLYSAHGLTKAIEAEVPCKGCQSNGWAVKPNKDGDWRVCMFDDYACTLTMSSQRFEAALKDLGVL